MGKEALKICFVTTFYPPYHFGGDAVYVHRLANALAREGHRVDVIHSIDAFRLQHPDDPEDTFTDHPNVRRIGLENKQAFVASLAAHQFGRPVFDKKEIRDRMERENYDVIHYHNISLVGGPGVLRLGSALKLYTAHEYWMICATHVLFRLNKEACTRRTCLRCTLHSGRPPQLWRGTGLLERCLEHVDCLLMPSRFALQQHQAQGITRPMTVMPLFAAPPRGVEDGEAHPAVDGPYFLFVGRLEKLKGIQDLLPLFRDYRQASLVVVGTGAYREELEEQARDLENVRFLGAIHPDGLGALYSGAIAVIIPSLCYETFGLVAVEAFTYGTPVISRRIGALPEVIDDSGGGCTFTNLEECRQAMEELQSRPEWRDELGEKGRAMALQRWTEEGHVNRYLGLVRALMAHRAEHPGDPLPRQLGTATIS